jgi:hypothetical protein
MINYNNVDLQYSYRDFFFHSGTTTSPEHSPATGHLVHQHDVQAGDPDNYKCEWDDGGEDLGRKRFPHVELLLGR